MKNNQISGLKLSIIIIAYNMARELPRTLQSLLPPIQQGIDTEDYEIIVVDNSSTKPFDCALCQAYSPNITILTDDSGNPSPAAAINTGINQAKGELIGVMIDGARMASPGLLKTALEAAQIDTRAVIGTLALHLGNDTQVKSVTSGYDQTQEDQLLTSVPWQEDGYHLFDISVFAPSSARGWFSIPSETNAIFMNKTMWQEIGGYDEQFQLPGGGLVNLNTWYRACSLNHCVVIILIGEATFHQFHNSVATNIPESNWELYNQEYISIRGHAYQSATVENVKFYGQIHGNQTKSILNSAYHLSSRSTPAVSNGNTPELMSRPFESNSPSFMLSGIQQGVMKSKYRYASFLKSPFDIGIYLQLLSKQQPQSIIEIGTKDGGSALWFADMLEAANVKNPTIVSIDINPIASVEDKRIIFMQGDAANLDAVLTKEFLMKLPRPLLVIEDSSHFYQHSYACLNFFHDYLQTDDYIVIEDGIVSQLPESNYRLYDSGPNRAVTDFLAEHGADYEIDTALCDHYGFNLTYNPNGYLKRL